MNQLLLICRHDFNSMYNTFQRNIFISFYIRFRRVYLLWSAYEFDESSVEYHNILNVVRMSRSWNENKTDHRYSLSLSSSTSSSSSTSLLLFVFWLTHGIFFFLDELIYLFVIVIKMSFDRLLSFTFQYVYFDLM